MSVLPVSVEVQLEVATRFSYFKPLLTSFFFLSVSIVLQMAVSVMLDGEDRTAAKVIRSVIHKLGTQIPYYNWESTHTHCKH